jgi:hypothetical protein
VDIAECAATARSCLQSYILWLNDSTAKHLLYEVTTYRVDGTHTIDTVDLRSKPGYSLTESNSYTICVDMKVAVFVEHVSKTVFVVDRSKASMGDQNPQSVTEQFLGLFFEGQYTCLVGGDSIVIERSFEVPQEYIQGFLAHRARLTLNTKTNMMNTITMDVDERSGVRLLRIVYLTVEAKEIAVQHDPLSLVYESDGRIKASLKKYTVYNQLEQ